MMSRKHWVSLDLTAAEEVDSVVIGKERDEQAKKTNSKHHMIDKNNDMMDNEIMGVRGEVAVSNYFGVPFANRDKTVGGHDVVLSCGLTIEVRL